ncbi:Uracil phosphoribosyltransferase [Phytophthora citrophthora]|uniref:Uracil phosphoribosyltransferase n=1 Tax=Phytophthora citrophthora TaxID=4793 RepID=A0AAD9GVY0_9STRA|nr:Uracil phosphoribosyltransferase [Phytophthora citrophthora]
MPSKKERAKQTANSENVSSVVNFPQNQHLEAASNTTEMWPNQVEIFISPSSTETSSDRGPEARDSGGQQDRELKAALSAWLRSQSHIDQERNHGGDSCQDFVPSTNVKISLQYTPPPRKRASRYLREQDRREIITRIRSGEQQVTLAKEFGVSRAAICNLYKNRQEILARAAGDPQATHPKKTHFVKTTSELSVDTHCSSQAEISLSSPLSTHVDPIDDRLQCSPRMVDGDDGHEVASVQNDIESPSFIQATIEDMVISPTFSVREAVEHSIPCRNLVAALRDERISSTEFQQLATRLARLLIEEALAILPFENEEVTNQFGDICHVPKTLNERDICGVSMEGRGSVLLRAFSDIIPMAAAGIVSLGREDTTNAESTPQVKAYLPIVRPGQVVLLFDIQIATGNEACVVLRHLVVDKQIPADQIYFVTIISSFEGLQKVSRQYPGKTNCYLLITGPTAF